ncbi:uncharacterized protein ACA1_391140 [Acanthamoeba castellanii str. Neff]|uniref:Glycosyltransferase family 92 protein n=1 Tax=Acanthamoeba castellanii (strain ATCC 30010 / Neff) TaxID=1257118 RepID=L8GRJ3_ACACF|nr:uncharacterized protein ACA1_391140 [Acanthamoeba castellanii str. Neff]ELR14756.1 hypothetical protein ACA1_391140 [Acanthamoeba castellanii str. Neff]
MVRLLRVISASQDHRAWFPNASALPTALRPRTFHNLTQHNPSMRVFQLHLAVSTEVFNYTLYQVEVPTGRTFQGVELWWSEPPSAAAIVDAEKVVKLPAHSFILDQPAGAGWRYQFKPGFMELVVRCAFFIPEGERMLHFPKPAPLLPTAALATPREPLPSAPWAGISELGAIVRATGDDARVRVGVWITRQFTWTADVDLWLLWTLDVVGVDHVVLELASVDLDIKDVERRLARHPGVLERVTIVAVDAPGRDYNVTYCHLQELLVWDGFVRFQADFDFVFLVDTDEFVQLFSTEPPYERVDVKTFIARNRERVLAGGHAYLHRLRVARTQPNRLVEPGLPAFLRGVLGRDGAQMQTMATAGGGGTEEQGKSLFNVNGAVQPYLHYSMGYPMNFTDVYPTHMWAQAEAHVLHIREKPDESKRAEPWANGTLTWWLTLLEKKNK